MDEPWKLLETASDNTVETIWYKFAKQGQESAVFAPLAQYPNAAGWLARSFAANPDYRIRKLGAMLAGWMSDPKQIALLSEMLDCERATFRNDPLSANSVGEDIMFAATRWSQSQNAQVRTAGIDILATMISDALHGTTWNTVNWAVANLHRATEGKHEIFTELMSATESQMEGQRFFQNAVKSVKRNDTQALGRAFTPPSELCSLASDDPNYPMMSSLWNAAAAAEAASEAA